MAASYVASYKFINDINVEGYRSIISIQLSLKLNTHTKTEGFNYCTIQIPI